MNSEAIISRLKEIVRYYNLTLSTFADSIDVQRSSISHLMSGRNKPSLDFVLKIIDNYPDVDLYWLLNGTGSFPKTQEIQQAPAPSPEVKPIEEPPVKTVSKEAPSLFSTFDAIGSNETKTQEVNTTKKLVKIILLYDDGSFEDYNK